MNPSASPSGQSEVHRWLWRWHGYAGLFVIPFIFFMALTGLPYVWEHELEDWWHPEYRALTPQATRVPYEQQLTTAHAALPDKPLYMVKVDNDPRHATQFMFGTSDDPVSVFVNPYSGTVITQFSEWTRLSYAAISLHGLTFIEPYGSWLLELLACWGIVLCITGVYLWWPRGKGKLWGVFLPRLRSDGRTRWRDLHAVTGFYFAAVLALYLITGLPWTAFWGGKLMSTIQDATEQSYPHCMSSEAGMQSVPPTPDAKPVPLDAFVNFGLQQNLPGHLEITLPADNTRTVHLQNQLNRATVQKHFQLDLFTAKPVGTADWNDMPITQQAVALGISLHEGQLFGRITQITSTLLACIFMLMAGAGVAMWWKRRPQGKLDWPQSVTAPPLPLELKAALIALGFVLPMLGLSFIMAAFFSKTRRS